MTKPFPHEYSVKLKWKEKNLGTLESKSGLGLIGGPPPEFDGTDEWWSPEELLLGSLELCLMNYFHELCARSEFTVQNYSSRATGIMDMGSDDRIHFLSIKVDVEIKTDNEELAKELMNQAIDRCLISHTLNIDPEVNVSMVN